MHVHDHLPPMYPEMEESPSTPQDFLTFIFWLEFVLTSIPFSGAFTFTLPCFCILLRASLNQGVVDLYSSSSSPRGSNYIPFINFSCGLTLFLFRSIIIV